MLVLLAVAAPLPAADVAPLLPDATVLARAGSLPVEERRYLVYLYARLNKPKVAEALAASLLAADPADRQTLLVLASMYVEQKDPQAALRTAHRFLRAYPGDHQGRYFLGAGHYLAKEYAESARVLRELKREQFAGRKYPYETDLASAYNGAGDWYRAMLSYQELLRHHDLGDELRDEVRRVLDDLYRTHLPRIDLGAVALRLDRADLARATAAHGRHLSDRHWLDVRYARDEVTLEAAPGLRGSRTDREEFAAHLATAYDRRWRTELWAGRSGEGLFGGGRATYTFARQREVSVEVAGNVRATDSLTLEALDGRQDHAALAASWLIEADLVALARAHVRELHVARAALGRSTGVDFNLDLTLWRQGPRVVLGYRGSIAAFTPDAAFPAGVAAPIADPAFGAAAQQAVADNLVSRRLNRHGIGLLVTDNLADAWLYRFNAGADYDFELGSTGWNAALGLTWLPRKSIEITGEGGYTSSANASNAGSAASYFNFSLRAYY